MGGRVEWRGGVGVSGVAMVDAVEVRRVWSCVCKKTKNYMKHNLKTA